MRYENQHVKFSFLWTKPKWCPHYIYLSEMLTDGSPTAKQKNMSRLNFANFGDK